MFLPSWNGSPTSPMKKHAYKVVVAEFIAFTNLKDHSALRTVALAHVIALARTSLSQFLWYKNHRAFQDKILRLATSSRAGHGHHFADAAQTGQLSTSERARRRLARTRSY